jgi:ribosomal protein S3
MVEDSTTLIRVYISTKKALDILGKKNDSYDDIIKKLLKKRKGCHEDDMTTR